MLAGFRVAAVALFIGGCTLGTVQPVRAPAPPPPDLPAVFDCLRERGVGRGVVHHRPPQPAAAGELLDSFPRS
ncbi:MAG: hypothetical protein ACK4Z0_02375, partial [Sphingomonadaceae bacterium]